MHTNVFTQIIEPVEPKVFNGLDAGTIHLTRPWTSAFFRLASGTVGFSPRLKNSGHVITFLRRCVLQNTDNVMPFWLWTAWLIFPPLSKSRGRKDVLCAI